jgi:XTP/dITP diphosphohydrolase
MRKLLIATHNKSKYDYFKKLFSGFNLQILSLDDLKIKGFPEEIGKDETENALIKASFFAKNYHIPSFADDAGMYIEALGGEPGVQVRRWGGRFLDDISDKEWLDYFLDRMKDVSSENRKGKFKVVRAIVTPDGRNFIMKRDRDFRILEKPDWKSYKKGWPMSSMVDKPLTTMPDDEIKFLEKENLEELKNIINQIYD